MKFKILAVGKLKDPGLRALCDDYAGRIRRYAELEELELRDDAALLKALPQTQCVIALEVNGRGFTSQQFSRALLEWASLGLGPVTFVIGGAEGNPPLVRERARAQMSLSTMTLPHRLARLLLLEQIYRGLSIWRGEPYARED